MTSNQYTTTATEDVDLIKAGIKKFADGDYIPAYKFIHEWCSYFGGVDLWRTLTFNELAKDPLTRGGVEQYERFYQTYTQVKHDSLTGILD